MNTHTVDVPAGWTSDHPYDKSHSARPSPTYNDIAMHSPPSKVIKADPPAATPPTRGNGSMYRTVRRLIVFILGMSVMMVGFIMLVTPGPGLIVIPLGLAILATEFVWAKCILHALKERLVNSGGDDKSTRLHRFVAWLSNLCGVKKPSPSPNDREATELLSSRRSGAECGSERPSRTRVV